MKISRNTPQQLIVGNNPIFFTVMLAVMGLVFLGVGMASSLADPLFGIVFAAASLLPFGLLLVFSRRVQLIFEADKGTLTIQRKNLLRGASKVVHQLSDVERAELETTQSDGTTMYRVTMMFTGESAGPHPITGAYSNVGNHKSVAQTINAWLDSYRSPA